MLRWLTLILGCQLLGEVTARGLGLPLPGPVIGMAALFAGLCVVRRVPLDLERTSTALLRHLSLLFIPAGVGVVAHLGLIGRSWPALLAALVVSTALAIAVTGLVAQALLRRDGRR